MIVSFGTVQHICKNINKNTVLSQKNQSFFAKVLYCPKKTKKNNSFQSSKSYRLQAFHKIGFFWNSTALLQKRLVFLGQYSTFARKLTKTLYCPKKTNLFLLKCCTVPKKTKKTNLFRSWDLAGQQDRKRLVFLVFLGQYSTFAKKDWVFWDSTALLQEN